MPVAIIVTDQSIPAIIEREDDTALLAVIDALKVTPKLDSVAQARRWLATLAPPSGYYQNRAEALGFANAAKVRAKAPPALLTPESIRDARKELGLSRVAFGQALGFNGNPNTVNKEIHRLETNGDRGLSKEKQEALFALMAEHELEPAES